MKKLILIVTAFLFVFAVSAQNPKTETKKEVKKEVKQEVKSEHKCAGDHNKDHKCADKGKDAKGCCDKNKDKKECADKGKDHKCADKGKDAKGCCDKSKDKKECADKGKDHKGCTDKGKDHNCADKGKDGKCCPEGEAKNGDCCKDGKGHAYGHNKDGKCGRDFGQERAKNAKNKVEKETVVKEVAAEVDQAIVTTKNRTQEARTAVQDKYKKKQITKAQYEEKIKRIDEIEKEVIRIENERKATDQVIKAKVS
jgi:hypothetical protein